MLGVEVTLNKVRVMSGLYSYRVTSVTLSNSVMFQSCYLSTVYMSH
jgi:hypothetical protein